MVDYKESFRNCGVFIAFNEIYVYFGRAGHRARKHLQMISSFSKSDFQLIRFNEVLVLFLIRASITDYILFDKKSQWGPSDTPGESCPAEHCGFHWKEPKPRLDTVRLGEKNKKNLNCFPVLHFLRSLFGESKTSPTVSVKIHHSWFTFIFGDTTVIYS